MYIICARNITSGEFRLDVSHDKAVFLHALNLDSPPVDFLAHKHLALSNGVLNRTFLPLDFVKFKKLAPILEHLLNGFLAFSRLQNVLARGLGNAEARLRVQDNQLGHARDLVLFRQLLDAGVAPDKRGPAHAAVVLLPLLLRAVKGNL